MKTCPKCNGTGGKMETCFCRGTGYNRNGRICTDCNGVGSRFAPCSKCRGSGTI